MLVTLSAVQCRRTVFCVVSLRVGWIHLVGDWAIGGGGGGDEGSGLYFCPLGSSGVYRFLWALGRPLSFPGWGVCVGG